MTRKGRHAAPRKADRLRVAAYAVLAALVAGLVALAVAMLASGH